jgi:hypothetical protein
MAAGHRRTAISAALDFPVATLVHLIAVVTLAVVFIANGGQLPDDTVQFFAIVEGGNGLLAIGRGHAARKPG